MIMRKHEGHEMEKGAMGGEGAGKAPVGSSHDTGKKTPHGIDLHALHEAGKTHPTFNADRMAHVDGKGHKATHKKSRHSR
jgi:hypothetical protein